MRYFSLFLLVTSAACSSGEVIVPNNETLTPPKDAHQREGRLSTAPTCDDITCDAGYECVVLDPEDVYCINPPCDAIATCVAADSDADCSVVLCPPGTVCEMQDVVCLAPPCDPVAVCVSEAPVDSCDGICGEQAPSGCWCDDLCTWFGDCCVDADELCTPPDLPTCDDITCAPGTHCEEQECMAPDGTPCPVVCVDDTPTSCEDLECPAGQHCESTQCLIPPCPVFCADDEPEEACNLIDCPPDKPNCINVDCRSGDDTCMPAVCVANSMPDCDDLCGPGHVCDTLETLEAFPPHTVVAACAPTCEITTCDPGEVCVDLEGVACFAPPCPPSMATCVPETTEDACNLIDCPQDRPNCINIDCTNGGEGCLEAVCVANAMPGCDAICEPGHVCDILETLEAFPPTSIVAACEPTCEIVTCGPGETCVDTPIECFTAPCPPTTAGCVQTPVQTCADVTCPAGQHCIEFQCLAEEGCPELRCVDDDSCEESCGTAAPAGCYCDPYCATFDDCCADKIAFCGE